MPETDCCISDLYKNPAVYDQLCSGFGGETFFSNIATERGGLFLELACGTGRIVAAVACRGVHCFALDISNEMVEYTASRHANLGINVYPGDMTSFSFAQRFGCIVLGANSLQHLTDIDDWRRVFERAYCHLESGGEFVVSLVNPSPVMTRNIDDSGIIVAHYDRPTTGESVSIFHSFNYDELRKIGVTTWTHRLASGDCIMQNVFHMLYHSPEFVISLAMSCGFNKVISYGGFDMSMLTDSSPLQVHRFSI